LSDGTEEGSVVGTSESESEDKLLEFSLGTEMGDGTGSEGSVGRDAVVEGSTTGEIEFKGAREFEGSFVSEGALGRGVCERGGVSAVGVCRKELRRLVAEID